MTKQTQNLVKCSLLLQVNNAQGIDYVVSPAYELISHCDVNEYVFEIDLNKVNIIKVEVLKHTAESNIIIKQLKINNTLMDNLNTFSHFNPAKGGIIKTHGYISQKGVYQIKIHTNLISQNYLGYLLSLTK